MIHNNSQYNYYIIHQTMQGSKLCYSYVAMLCAGENGIFPRGQSRDKQSRWDIQQGAAHCLAARGKIRKIEIISVCSILLYSVAYCCIVQLMHSIVSILMCHVCISLSSGCSNGLGGIIGRNQGWSQVDFQVNTLCMSELFGQVQL